MAPPRKVLTIPEVATNLGISRASVYVLINNGELQTTDVGTGGRARTRVFEDSVTALLERRASKPPRKGRAA